MNNILAVFKSRNHTMQFSAYLRKLGVNYRTINTPREVSVSCGISIIFPKSAIYQARMIVDKFQFSSFDGFYEVIENGVFRNYRRI